MDCYGVLIDLKEKKIIWDTEQAVYWAIQTHIGSMNIVCDIEGLLKRAELMKRLSEYFV